MGSHRGQIVDSRAFKTQGGTMNRRGIFTTAAEFDLSLDRYGKWRGIRGQSIHVMVFRTHTDLNLFIRCFCRSKKKYDGMFLWDHKKNDPNRTPILFEVNGLRLFGLVLLCRRTARRVGIVAHELFHATQHIGSGSPDESMASLCESLSRQYWRAWHRELASDGKAV